jgi:hypothetical protein
MKVEEAPRELERVVNMMISLDWGGPKVAGEAYVRQLWRLGEYADASTYI